MDRHVECPSNVRTYGDRVLSSAGVDHNIPTRAQSAPASLKAGVTEVNEERAAPDPLEVNRQIEARPGKLAERASGVQRAPEPTRTVRVRLDQAVDVRIVADYISETPVHCHEDARLRKSLAQGAQAGRHMDDVAEGTQLHDQDVPDPLGFKSEHTQLRSARVR